MPKLRLDCGLGVVFQAVADVWHGLGPVDFVDGLVYVFRHVAGKLLGIHDEVAPNFVFELSLIALHHHHQKMTHFVLVEAELHR